MTPRQHHVLIERHHYFWHWEMNYAGGERKTVHREQGQYRLHYDSTLPGIINVAAVRALQNSIKDNT